MRQRRLRPPAFDPDQAALDAGVDVSYWGRLPWLGVYGRVDDGHGEIGLRGALAQPTMEPLRRVVLAHELGHHALHAGIYVRPFECRRDDLIASHVEAQAERWAAARLVPVALVRQALVAWEAIGPEEMSELADLARVPDAFIAWWLADLDQRGVLLAPHMR